MSRLHYLLERDKRIREMEARLKDAEDILDRVRYWVEEPKAMEDARAYFEKYKDAE